MDINGNMKIRCKVSRRFLLEMDIESYLENLKSIGIRQEKPIRITVPCPRCHKVEVYEVYEDRYVFIENKKMS